MPSTNRPAELILFDASLPVGALLRQDARHREARPIVEAARRGEIGACTTPGILSETYRALTWEKELPRHEPDDKLPPASQLTTL